MHEPITAPTRAAPTGLAWVWARLFPRGVASLMLAAYGMILAAMVTFALFQRDLDPPRYYLGLMGLSAMFVLHVVVIDLEARLGEPRASMLHLLTNGLLWLVVSWAAFASDNFSFVPYLLFLLVAQAMVNWPPRIGAAYTVGMLLCWHGLLWLQGHTLGELLANFLALSGGLIFVITFSYVLRLFRAQTERAEALLAQLQAANAELEGARRREKELAAAEERVRIARDIHDGLGHHLTALNVQLQAAARLLERDPARAAAAVATSREVAQAALDEVRQSVAAMRRTPLDGRGLPEALATLVGDFQRRADLVATLEVAGSPVPLSPAAAQTLFRAAQEGLTNAQRHAAAGSVHVSLVFAPAAATLAVADDGAGAALSFGGGFGLAGLRERAEQLGGRFAAGPRPGGGFLLELEVPAAPDEASS